MVKLDNLAQPLVAPRGIRTEMMDVTPEMAEAWLRQDDPNRKVRPGHVSWITGIILRGEWRPTHQGIAFDEDGRLVDGRHRLLAIVKAGRTVSMLVTFGLPRDAFDVIDSGAKRTPGDVLYIAQVPNANLVAAAARLVICYDDLRHGVWSGTNVNNMLSAHRVTEHVTSDRFEWAEAVRQTWPTSRTITIVSSVLVAVAFVIIREERDDGYARELFFDALSSGENLRRGDPRLTLRNMYLGPRSDRRTTTRQYQFAVLVKAWNGFLKGNVVHLLKWTHREPMPAVLSAGRELDSSPQI